MHIDEFKIGQRVRIKGEESGFAGFVGTITAFDGMWIIVDLDHMVGVCPFKPVEVEVITQVQR